MMNRRHEHAMLGVVLIGWLALVLPAAAQDSLQPSPPEPPAAEDAPEQEPAPTLDELLGLPARPQRDSAKEAADRLREEELRRKLEEEAIGDAFAQAIEQMSLSADLLDRDFDPGLGTQRVQEDIIRKLDQLIEYARKQSSQCSGSSGNPSRSRSQSPGQQPRPDQQPGQQDGAASESGAGAEPPRQDGDIGTELAESGSEWGSLPPRVRDELLQGRREKYSSLYEQLTRQYYQRLAEEGSP
jgi:hypothetical protein